MMKILHVSCSPRGNTSESYRLSRKIIKYLLEREPAAIVVDRVIGAGAIPHIDESYATALGGTRESSAERFPEGTMARSDELIQELEHSDCVVIGTPMHNFTIPSALKAWVDHIVRVRRTFNATKEGYKGLLRNRPIYVAVSSGGRYSGGLARQPDFLTPYMRTVLGVIGFTDVTFFSVEGSSLGPEAVAEARAGADRALREHFSPSRARLHP
ncbi:NAD(P)H-dependent oxidoreductase [Bradyrhizobium liaoningense]|nr:NAD(P)H-dependent oxidoreductase [Bradyrhizobium liaoningense]